MSSSALLLHLALSARATCARPVAGSGPLACCARGTCAGGAAEPIFSLRQFLPGIGESPKRARTEHEWEAALARFLEPATPDVLVFNAGLHLLDYPSPPDELRKILRALLLTGAMPTGKAREACAVRSRAWPAFFED